jgi:putative transposase
MGVSRYGKFESTYNDNGSSEKSALADQIVAQLLLYGMRFQDEAEAYRTENNQYIVDSPMGEVLDIVSSKEEWRKKHRRVFAGVKNANAKPIERFFGTLEQILRDLCLPGYVKEVGMSAAEDEEATRRLEWQKSHGFILSPEEFIAQVMKAIDIYHHRRHGTLGRSPFDELDFAIKEQGFQVKKIDDRDIKYLFLEQARAKVRGNRVQLMGYSFEGPRLTAEMLRENRGSLVSLDGLTVELRFDPDDVESGGGIWAIDPRDKRSIFLTQTDAIDPSDEETVRKAIRMKRANMHPVREAFRTMTSLALPGPVLSDPGKYKELTESVGMADRAALPLSEPPSDDVDFESRLRVSYHPSR